MAPKRPKKKPMPAASVPRVRGTSRRVDHGNQGQPSRSSSSLISSEERPAQQESRLQQNCHASNNDRNTNQEFPQRNEEENQSRFQSESQRSRMRIRQALPQGFQAEGLNLDPGEQGRADAHTSSVNPLAPKTHTEGESPAVHTQNLVLRRRRPFEQHLPEPALTVVLPKQRAASMPSVNQQELSSMLATTEQYLSVLRLNQNMQVGRPAGISSTNPSRIASDGQISLRTNHCGNATSLPSIQTRDTSLPGNVDGKLPAVTKQLLAEAEARKRAYHERRLQAVRARQIYPGNGTLGRTIPNINAGASVIRGLSHQCGRVVKVTPRSFRPHRLMFRGPSNGYRSFGDLVQVDMPSPSLEHFSITKFSRTASEYGRTSAHQQCEPRFSVFQELLKRPELIITLAGHLRVQELLILYRICKPFHNIINQRYTTVILSQALRRAPESAKIFPFRCYSKLCIDDPGQRPHPIAQRAAVGHHRKVPSFRWLLMICFREMACHEIRMIMAEDGTPLPEQCESVMKKIWFVMDIPDSTRRIGTIQNREIFTDADIFFATLLFVKMDMRFTDPVTGSGRDGMRRMLLSQPSLSAFWKTLKRTALTSKMDAVKMFVRWKWQPPARLTGQPIFDIPAHEIGIMQFEGWGRTGSRVCLQRPDDIILKESIHRRLNLQAHYTDMFLWGYVNPRSLQDIPPIPERRNLERLEGMEELLVPDEDKRNKGIGKPVSERVVFI
ncbi:predicted protein [Uncinocarpus reesii 1704]|uniref:F-box domain-containing protein n=1 Tax=Uncinocarpus reesii (strain UAMH 1704) TaxID=336963 RepID=C4JM51_UNCRE|nr:uncharacterized protein UREG_03909 [Uncinocarpus reesii 1704]EEP79063.1 predicted protein [Uncinocarpus reesii 1704]